MPENQEVNLWDLYDGNTSTEAQAETTETQEVKTVANQEFTDKVEEGFIKATDIQVGEIKTQEPDLSSIIAEKTGGKYSDFDQLLTELNKEKEVIQPVFEGEAEKIYSYLKEGKEQELTEYLTLKNTDFSAIPKEELLERYIKSTKPHLSEDSVEAIMTDRYGFGKQPLSDEDKELLSEDQVKAYERDLRLSKAEREEALAEALNFFNSKKGELKLPDLPKQVDSEYEEYLQYKQQAANQQEESERAAREYQESVEQIVPQIKELSVAKEIETSVGKVALDSKFQLSTEQQQQVKEYLLGLNGGSDYDNKEFVHDNKVDYRGLSEEAAWRIKPIREAMLDALLKDYAAKIQETFVEKEIKRYDGGAVEQSATFEKGLTPEQRLWNAF